jgi:hypothetical protein
MRAESPFPVLARVDCGGLRAELHRSLAVVIFRDDAVRRNLFEKYAGSLDGDEEQLWGFLCDFRGFFTAASDPRHYSLVFECVFPHRLEQLAKLGSASLATVIALVKMWAAMLRNDRRRIQFKQHSPNGIILFHDTAELMGSLFERMIEGLRLENDSCVSFLCACFRILDSALTADYVPFAAFEIFHDDALKRMLRCYVKATLVIPVPDLSRYPKVEKILQQLNCSVVKRHVEATADPEVLCSNLIVQVIYFGLRSVQPEAIRYAMEAMSALVLGHFSRLTSVERQTFLNACFRVWHICFTKGNYDAKLCLTHLIATDPASLDVACERMRQMAIPEMAANLESLCLVFVAELRDLFGRGEGPNVVMKTVDEFLSAVRRFIKAPNHIFDV